MLETWNPYNEDKFVYGRGADFNTVVVTAESDMESLVCYAPVWNSTEWVKKETPLKIKGKKVKIFHSFQSGLT